MTIDLHITHIRCSTHSRIIGLVPLHPMSILVISVPSPKERPKPGIRDITRRLSAITQPITIKLQQSNHLQAWRCRTKHVLLQRHQVSHGNKNTNNTLTPESNKINILGRANQRTNHPKSMEMPNGVRNTINMHPYWLHNKLRDNILLLP
jgi:hypothetical protein